MSFAGMDEGPNAYATLPGTQASGFIAQNMVPLKSRATSREQPGSLLPPPHDVGERKKTLTPA